MIQPFCTVTVGVDLYTLLPPEIKCTILFSFACIWSLLDTCSALYFLSECGRVSFSGGIISIFEPYSCTLCCFNTMCWITVLLFVLPHND